MKQSIGILLTIMIFNISVGMANEGRIQQTLNQFKLALNQHDFDALKPYLAVDFSFSGYEGDMGLMIMCQIVSQYSKNIKSIKILNSVKRNKQFIVSTEFNFQDENEAIELILSNDFKIIEAPIVKIQIAGHGVHSMNKPSPPAEGDNFPVKMVVQFDLAGRIIVVEAEIEGVRGNFFVDSGSPGFVLNSKRFPWLMAKAKPVNHSVEGAGGIIGNVKLIEATGFKWQNAKLNSVEALIYDMSHLEEITDTEIVGVIGAEFLRNFTIKFDYSQNELTLYSEDQTEYWQNTGVKTINFDMIGHIPVIETKIGDHSLRFGIDCGAEGALLFKKWKKPLKSHYKILGQERLTGADKNSQIGDSVRLDEFEISDLSYKDHTFLFNNLNFGHELQIDGLLGYEFLSQYITAIDYKNQKLYIWDAATHS